MEWGIWRIIEERIMRASKKRIREVLNSAELERNLERDLLVRIYEAEARVVFMRRRGSILKDIRDIIVGASEKEQGVR